MPVGLPAVLYIGVRNNGDIETPQANLDETQKKFNRHMESVYPRIAYVPKIVIENGLQALAIIIPGSDLRPHFAGLSYIRKGSETFAASEQQYDELIASRSSKVREILKWKDKIVTVLHLNTGNSIHVLGRVGSTVEMVVVDCNSFYVTLSQGGQTSFSLQSVELSFDHQRNRLALEVRPN